MGPCGDRTRPLQRLVSLAIARPALVLSVGVALAIVGWGVGTQIATVSRSPPARSPQPAARSRTSTPSSPRPAPPESSKSWSKPRPDRPGDDRMDGRLQAPRPCAERSHRRPGPVGLPHPRRRQGHRVRHRSDPRGALLVLPPPGRPARPEDRQGRPRRADQLRHPLADAGRTAAADRQRPRRGRQPARRASRSASPACR